MLTCTCFVSALCCFSVHVLLLYAMFVLLESRFRVVSVGCLGHKRLGSSFVKEEVSQWRKEDK